MAVQNQKANEDLFDAYFRRADLDGDGQISGAEAVAFFQGSNLPKHVLAQVWMHADQKKLSYLGRAEFYNALKLVTVAQSKRELTPDMVKAALYGPASAKIPAPQINLAATPAPQSKAAAPVAQAVGATSAPSQSTGIGRPQNVGHASTNQQYFSSQQSQLNRSPQAMPPVVPPQPQQALASQGISSGATMATPHPPNSTLSTGWLAESTGGSLGGVNSQIPNRSINSSVNQEAFGLTASGLTSAAQPRPQVVAGQTFSMPPKSQDPAKPSNQLADKDAKASVVSGNGFASDSLFGDVFATSQPKQNSSAATTSTSSSSISSVAAQASLKPPLESFQSTVIQHPAGLQHQQSVSTAKPAQHISSQSTTSSSSTGFSVGAGNSASSQSSQSMPWPKMTPADVQKYTKVFMQVDSDRDGKITGEQARNLFLSWRLPREVLKQVWDLSDQDNDSMLSLKEFCIALYLMERYREGRPLPTMLPSTILPSETLFTGTGQPTASYGSASWGPMHGFQQPQVPSASRPPSAARGKPPRPVPSSHGDGAIQSGNQKPKVPVLEKHLVDQLSKEEQDSLNTKFQEATAVNKKVEELEKEVAESKQKIEFCRVKMQELVLYKSRCDNRLNEIMERVSADKREVESLAKKYEEKYKQSGDVASRLTIEEATFRDIQEKKMELYQAIVKIEDGDTANGVLKERAERIESGLEELIKAVNERCKQYGLRAKPTSLVELPFGWQPGIQEAAADWDENWDKFDNEEFTFVKELTLDVENVIAPPKPKSSSSQNETAPSTDESSNISSSNLDDKLEKVPSTGENIPEKELASEQGDVLERTPPGSPAGSSAVENQPQGLQDSNHVKSSDADGSPHAKGTRSDHVPAESAVSGDKNFDEPSWGTFDTHYDTDSVWAFDQESGKDMDHGKHDFSSGFGLDDFSIKPIKTGSTNMDNMFPGRNQSLFADSVPSTPAYSFVNSPRRFSEGSEFGMTTETPRTDNMFLGNSPFTFADSVPSTPAYNFGNSPRRFSEDHSFDSFSRFDSFNMHDSGFSQSPRHSLARVDSVRSTSDSEFFPSRFDSFNAQRFDSFNAQRFDSFNAHDGGFSQSQSPRSLARFDSMRSSKDSDYGHGFSSFDDTDPFGSGGPFRTSLDSQTPRRSSDQWSAF